MLFIFVFGTYASIFHYKIDSLEEFSIPTDIVRSFTCFKL